MSDHDGDFLLPPRSEEELERQLAQHGPLMGRQEEAEAELDAVFAARLRAHLLDNRELTPHPTFARNLRSRLLRRPGARPIYPPRAASRWVSLGVSAFATAVLLIVILIGRSHQSGTRTSSIAAPYPQRADLIFSFPSLQETIHRLTPVLSLVHPSHGVPYAGHLRLHAASLPHEPTTLPAYRLASRPGVAVLGRALLAISSPVTRVRTADAIWLVAADGGARTHRPLHSLAVSTRTGELIYHDRRNSALARARRSAGRRRAIALARTWLVHLGWPGNRMPLGGVTQVPGRPKVRAVVLGWPDVGLTATAAATLWITPNGSIIEAWVWPPIARHGMVPARSVTAAWNQVRGGALPLAVQGINPLSHANGVGTLQATQVVSVLTARNTGTVYLVPTYRFLGTARISGAIRATWYSLAPGMSK